jgi:DNA-binding transcriptional LysR family regulator
VEGRLIVYDAELMVTAALEGIGLGRLPEPVVRDYLLDGRLVAVLEDWSHTLPGIFLYHPSRRQTPMPLQVFLRFIEQWRRDAFDQA